MRSLLQITPIGMGAIALWISLVRPSAPETNQCVGGNVRVDLDPLQIDTGCRGRNDGRSAPSKMIHADANRLTVQRITLRGGD